VPGREKAGTLEGHDLFGGNLVEMPAVCFELNVHFQSIEHLCYHRCLEICVNMRGKDLFAPFIFGEILKCFYGYLLQPGFIVFIRLVFGASFPFLGVHLVLQFQDYFELHASIFLMGKQVVSSFKLFQLRKVAAPQIEASSLTVSQVEFLLHLFEMFFL